MDFRQARHWEFKSVSPDVLILPSKLTPMAKDVMGSLVLNPGQLAKGNGGGTFAEMSVHPIKEDELRDSALQSTLPQDLPHGICKRSTVNILRI